MRRSGCQAYVMVEAHTLREKQEEVAKNMNSLFPDIQSTLIGFLLIRKSRQFSEMKHVWGSENKKEDGNLKKCYHFSSGMKSNCDTYRYYNGW